MLGSVMDKKWSSVLKMSQQAPAASPGDAENSCVSGKKRLEPLQQDKLAALWILDGSQVLPSHSLCISGEYV